MAAGIDSLFVFPPRGETECVAAILAGPTSGCPYQLLVEDALEKLDAHVRTLEGPARLHFIALCIDWCMPRASVNACVQEKMTEWMEDETELESRLGSSSRAADTADAAAAVQTTRAAAAATRSAVRGAPCK